MPKLKNGKKRKTSSATAHPYRHLESESLMRPEVGTQAQFKKKMPPKPYRYDSSLSPTMEWDDRNPGREKGESLLQQILQAETLEDAKTAASTLKAMSGPFLNWTGKAERLSFDVPTLPLFIHERLSTKAILETLKGHKRDRQTDMFELFGDPQHSITDQVLGAYEHRDKWVNRMILGDSLVVMNSLLHYESLGGEVQMIYFDPPYGVSFGSNFQPFVRKRNVAHGDDEDMTREPEMVQAYRDTWELGLHSYLTYLRDRFTLCRDLLSNSGSIFVQIGNQNVHHVREILEEVFGKEHHVVTIVFKKKGGQKGELIDPVNDYILWFAKDIERCRERFHQLYEKSEIDSELTETFRYVELPDGRELTLKDLSEEVDNGTDYSEEPQRLLTNFPGARIFKSENLTSGGLRRNQSVIFRYKGTDYDPGIAKGNCWKHTAKTDDGSPSGMDRLAAANRLYVGDKQLGFKRFIDDFGYTAISNWWDGLGGAAKPVYVVQTNPEVIKRCILMTTEPGDLVLDPTCGSGATAYVAEQWGRRWITIDTSRVPLALARQRLLTSTYDWYTLADEKRGPVGGFQYRRKKNKRGEEIGGLVPHITSTTLANNEAPTDEVLVDRPEIKTGITRVTGPFCVEATIPTPIDWEQKSTSANNKDSDRSFVDRMIEILRKSPVLRLEGNRTVTLKNIRPPAKSLSLSAEATLNGGNGNGKAKSLPEAVQEAAEASGRSLPFSTKTVALVFGPENGAVSEKLAYEAAREARAKDYSHLYVIGFAIQPNARQLIEKCDEVVGISATYIQATPDLMMGDLLKNMRSSQVFSVCGMPEAELRRVKSQSKEDPLKYEVQLLGMDVFDPATMEVVHRKGEEVPAWFLDTDYNGLCFHVSQAFFPRTGAWESLKKALKGEYEESVWDHLAGTTSTPFEAGEHGQIAVKVIDDRGNELLIVKPLSEAKK
jgi:adenine-specific DNA-methyltransferase